MAIIRPGASRSQPSNKPAGFSPSPRSWNNGVTSWCNKGGNVFLIMFKKGQALLLPGGRFLSPRNGRGEGAEQPRNIGDSWPQTRPFRERGQSQCRARTQIIRVREQSISAFRPRQQAWQQTVRIHGFATAFTVRKKELAVAISCPQSVRRLETSTPMNLPQTGIGRAFQQATNRPQHHIAISVFPPTSFPVHIQIIPTYVLI
jgi:hypothetical protein